MLLFRASSRESTDDFWFEKLPFLTGGSGHVTSASAMRLTAVYACVRVLAESFAILPFKMYRRRANGRGRDEVTDHWLVKLMARRPNRFQTPFAWREMMQGHLGLRGNAFNRIVEDGHGGVSELLPMHPDRTRIDLLDNGNWRYRHTDRNGREEVLRRDQVWHLRGLSDDGLIGYNPIEIAREAIAGALATQSFANRFFSNDARPGGWIEVPGQFESIDAKRKFRESWQELQGGQHRGKAAVLDKGMKYHELTLNNRDSQFIEARQHSISDIARMWRMPPHKIGDLTRSTNNNIEHQSLEFWIDTMLPWTSRWESSIECELLGEEDRDLQVEFDYKRLLRGDAASRSVYLTRMTNAGIFVRNEAREEEGKNPLPGLDEPLTPQNMSVGVDHGNEPGKPVQTPGQDDESEKASISRLNAVLGANAERLARRANADLARRSAADVFDDSFASLVAETLAVDLVSAENFCAWAQAADAEDPQALSQQILPQLVALATGVTI